MQTSDNMFLQNNSSIQLFIQEYKRLTSALEENCEEDILLLYSQIKISDAEHFIKTANFDIAQKDYRAAYDQLKVLVRQKEQIHKVIFCGACSGLSITLSYLNKYEESENILLEGIDICEELAEQEHQWCRLLARMYTNYVVLCIIGNVYDCINKGLEYSRKAYTIFEAQESNLDDTEKATFVNLCYNYGLLFLKNGKYKEASTYLVRSLDIINSLCEKSIQENYGLIHKTIFLAIRLGIKVGNIGQIKKKLEHLYSAEAIDSLISNLLENAN